jgi:hypothetical protein
MSKLLLLAAVLLLAQPAAAADWWSIGPGVAPGLPRALVLVDADSISPYGPSTAVSRVTVWETPVKGAKTVRSRDLFACPSIASQILRATRHDAQGRLIDSYAGELVPHVHKSGSIAEEAGRFVCAPPASRSAKQAVRWGDHPPEEIAARVFNGEAPGR